MMLTAGDRLVITAALQWAAMEHDKESKDLIRRGRVSDAQRKAQFAMECARLADLLKADS